MKNIKNEYWIIVAVIVVAVLISVVYVNANDRWPIFLSGIGLVVSAIAMGLSDKKKEGFNGSIEAVPFLLDTAINDQDASIRVNFKINNKSKESIQDFVYRLRIPTKILGQSFNSSMVSNGWRVYYHGESCIIIDDNYGFIAPDDGDGYASLQIPLLLNNWNKGNIYITITGSNISATTFKAFPIKKKISEK